MDFSRPWTAFALEAEADAFGFTRIATEHQRALAQARREGREEGLREAFLQDRHFLEGVCKSHPATREGNARIGSFLRGMMKLPLPTVDPEPAPGAKE